MAEDWIPQYEPWRHGGWYVTNLRHLSGAVGCVSRNFADKKWRIVCDPRPGSYPGGSDDHTYPNRDAAARAEKELADAAIAAHAAREAEAGGPMCRDPKCLAVLERVTDPDSPLLQAGGDWWVHPPVDGRTLGLIGHTSSRHRPDGVEHHWGGHRARVQKLAPA